jgi:hypothetical protein
VWGMIAVDPWAAEDYYLNLMMPTQRVTPAVVYVTRGPRASSRKAPIQIFDGDDAKFAYFDFAEVMQQYFYNFFMSFGALSRERSHAGRA